MSSTERLRAMLDERGESYVENDFGITWSYYSDPHTATESMDGTLQVTGLTPEQAIAATLGAGTCHMEPVKNYHVAKYVTSWGCVCSNCGGFHEFTHGEGWKYCPICKAEVVDQ